MKLVKWEFQGLHVPMMEDCEGNLYCTGHQICAALGLAPNSLRMMRLRTPDEFSELRVTSSDAKVFLEANRVGFGIQRLRDDMYLWSEDDMISAAVMAKSKEGREFRKGLRQFIKQHAIKKYVDLYEQKSAEYQAMQSQIDEIREHLNLNASKAGRELAAQKQTKHLRLVS